MLLPRSIVAAVRGVSLVVAALFATAAVFAAVVMPYRFWDSLAFGSWSRTIADGSWWADVPAPYLQRPLFYVEQGLAWRIFGHEEWIGRLLSLSFAVVLVVAVCVLARRLAPSGDAEAGAVLPPLAVLTVFASAVVATYAAAGMTDVPVAAMVAATGAAVWAERIGKGRLALVALLAAATVLAKPTGLLALAGLAAALLVLLGRRSLRGLAALGAGIGLALLYAGWQAARIDVGILDFLTAGNDEFWRERGAAARWDALARAAWLGAALRLVVLYGLAHALARVAGARPRLALGLAAAVAIGWSVVGPIVADGGTPYPFDGSLPGIGAWLVLAAAMVAAPFAADADPIARRTYAALLAWLAPMAIAWWAQRADDVRLLAPAWAPLVLLTAAALGALTLALVRLRPVAALAPAAAVALLAVANLPSVDGLGRESWRDLVDLGPSGWNDRAETENLAYGPFSYELNAARENVGEDERIVSSNGRLTYFFPGQVEVAYPMSCAALAGARFFSFLASGESLEFAAQAGQPTDPLAWLQCPQELTLVSEHEGIYAAYVVGRPPARAPAPEDCRIAAAAGQDVDAVFGDGLTYGEAKALRERAFAIGYTGGLKLERTGCSTFRVVVTGLPADDESVQTSFKRDAKKLGFDVTYAPGTRFPEVSPDVAAVP